MDLRLAAQDDLPRLKTMYQKIIGNMYDNNIRIWDEVYPCEFFQDDIDRKRLFLLTEDSEIAAAFALCESNDGEGHVKWRDGKEKALYLDRFGVNVKYLRKGVGTLMLKNAMALAKQKDARYLRLFVVDINKPAIDLYLKNGFKRAAGIYEEKISDDFVLYEYGFEREL
jgi:ribosomal protein S18 acetylase RimI-like enzyme